MLGTEIRECSQALLLLFSKAESQIFAVIAKQELLIEFWVAGVIRLLHPYAVDVSSGVEESFGEKSGEKISAFIDAVENA